MSKKFLLVPLAALALSAFSPAPALADGTCATHALPPVTNGAFHTARAQLFCGDATGSTGVDHTVCLEIFSADAANFVAVGCTPYTHGYSLAYQGLDVHSQSCRTAGSTVGQRGTGVYRTHSYAASFGFAAKADPLGDQFSEPVVLTCL